MPSVVGITSLQDPTVTELVQNVDIRSISSFFLGILFMTSLRCLLDSLLALIPFSRSVYGDQPVIVPLYGLNAGPDLSNSQGDATRLRSGPHRPFLSNFLNLAIYVTFALSALIQMISTLTFDASGGQAGCAVATALGSLFASFGEIIALGKLGMDLKILGISHWELRAFLALLLVAAVLAIVEQGLSTGSLSPSILVSFSFCDRRRFAIVSAVRSTVDLLGNIYTTTRLYALIVPERLSSKDLAATLSDVRVVQSLSLFILTLLTIVPNIVEINLAVDIIPFCVGAVILLMSFNRAQAAPMERKQSIDFAKAELGRKASSKSTGTISRSNVPSRQPSRRDNAPSNLQYIEMQSTTNLHRKPSSSGLKVPTGNGEGITNNKPIQLKQMSSVGLPVSPRSPPRAAVQTSVNGSDQAERLAQQIALPEDVHDPSSAYVPRVFDRRIIEQPSALFPPDVPVSAVSEQFTGTGEASIPTKTSLGIRIPPGLERSPSRALTELSARPVSFLANQNPNRVMPFAPSPQSDDTVISEEFRSVRDITRYPSTTRSNGESDILFSPSASGIEAKPPATMLSRSLTLQTESSVRTKRTGSTKSRHGPQADAAGLEKSSSLRTFGGSSSGNPTNSSRRRPIVPDSRRFSLPIPSDRERDLPRLPSSGTDDEIPINELASNLNTLDSNPDRESSASAFEAIPLPVFRRLPSLIGPAMPNWKASE